MAARRARAWAWAALAFLAASSCARSPPPLTGEQVQALSRADTYLAGEVKALRRDAVLDEGGLATAVGGALAGLGGAALALSWLPPPALNVFDGSLAAIFAVVS